MQTSKPISTISYNSLPFLRATLDHLLVSNFIDYWMFIPHSGENDGFGEIEKDHIHLYLIPNKRVNTADLDKFFIEPVIDNKPLRCILWNVSNPDDWILYCLHDPSYLASKLETRENLYTYGNIETSSEETLRRMYRHAYQSSGYARTKNLFEYARSGGTITDLLKVGAVPINMVNNYVDFFSICKKEVYHTEKDTK